MTARFHPVSARAVGARRLQTACSGFCTSISTRAAIFEIRPAMSTKKPAVGKPAQTVQPWRVAGVSAAPLAAPHPAATPAEDLLLVCLQDPFAAVGDSSSIVRVTVPTANGNAAQQWMLEAVMEMNTPRFFEGWATRGSFTLDLSVHAAAMPAAGTWGGTVRTTSGSGNCRVMVMRDSNKVRCSLASGARHAAEQAMPSPAAGRFLNADIAFELNGTSGLSAGAVAVVSNHNWSRLIAGSSAATQGLAFDGKWRQKLDLGDADSVVLGAWSFVVLAMGDYEALCRNHGWMPYILGDM